VCCRVAVGCVARFGDALGAVVPAGERRELVAILGVECTVSNTEVSYNCSLGLSRIYETWQTMEVSPVPRIATLIIGIESISTVQVVHGIVAERAIKLPLELREIALSDSEPRKAHTSRCDVNERWHSR